MNKKNYNNQTITDYLLGSLPEAETEYFDELSVTDDEFADALKSAENDLIDSYIRGELSDSNLEKFKTRYLVSPLRREKVEFAKAFQIFAEKNASSASEIVSDAKKSDSKRTFAARFSGLNIFSFSNAFPRWGFAAAVLVLAFIGGWFFLKNARFAQSPDELQVKRENFPQDQQNSLILPTANLAADTENNIKEKPIEELTKKEQTQNPPAVEQTPRNTQNQTAPTPKINIAPPKINIASFILAPPLRGGNQIQEISVSSEIDYVAMVLQIESEDYKSYRVSLINRATGKNLWQSGAIKPKTSGENKRLNIRFPAKLLQPQIYSLEVSGVSPNGAIENISDYSFRVVR